MTYSFKCNNQQPPSYSGVTINIANPALNMPCNPPKHREFATMPYDSHQITPAAYQAQYDVPSYSIYQPGNQVNRDYQNVPQAYPQQYYVNNYENFSEKNSAVYENSDSQANRQTMIVPKEDNYDNAFPVQAYNSGLHSIQEEPNTEVSKGIISELDARQAEQKELEMNAKKAKVVSLTNEYIMSLENYLNNPNTDIRLMAAKEILTRLDEDRNRYDDAALNALLNKMLQDPSKLIRVAALSALTSELASGNDYTVQLLNQIQQNPEADPEDVLEASQILLKRSTTTEVKYAPVYNYNQDKAIQEE